MIIGIPKKGNVINLFSISLLWQRLFIGIVMILVVFGNEVLRRNMINIIK